MTAEAREAAAMTHSAARLVLFNFGRTMAIEPVIGMRCGLQMIAGCMALRTAKRRVNASVANQAVCHLREVRLGNLVGLLEATMT